MKRRVAVWIWLMAFGRVIPAYAEPQAQDLVESLRVDDEATAHASQEMLVKMGSDAVRPLEKALVDSDFRMRRRAVEVLARLGPQAKHAAPALVMRLTDPHYEVHAAAENALIQMGDDAVPALSDALKSEQEGLRMVALSVLRRCGPKGIPILLKLLKKDESAYIRADAALALGAAHPDTEVVTSLIQALGDLEEVVRGGAADALGQQGPAAKAAIGPLLNVAQEDKDAVTRKKAADALLRIGPATKDSLAGLVAGLHDASVERRQRIVDVLGQSSIPFADALPVLESAMKDADAGIRLKVVHVGVSMSSGSAAALPLLREALRDAVVDVRASAIKGLGQLKGADSEAAGELGRLLADSNPVIRQDAIRALGNLGKAGMPGLLNALGDSYSALSDEAAKAIVRSGEDAVPSLQALQQSPDPHMRRIADQLLRRIQKKSHRRRA